MTRDLADKLNAFDPTLPLDRARTIPAAWYFDADIAAAERDAVFANTWQAVGRTDQVANPGCYFTADVAGEPILVVRDEQGTLRAFANVCRHRAAQVMCEAQGSATKLRCRYHGWTYDLAGKLRGVPEFDGVSDFRREDNGLHEYHVAVWGPMILVHLGKNPPPLAEFLAPLPQKTADRDLDKLRFVERREYELACNWKIFVDNYLDGGYHVNTVHPGLAGVLDYAQYRTEVFENSSVQLSPLKPSGDLGNVRSGDMAQYWWVFPNVMLNIYQGVMDTNHVWPLGPNRCRIVFDFYFANTVGPDAQKYIADSIAVAEQIQQEDIGICEEVQRGLASRSYDTGRFSVRREIAGYHFHKLLGRQLGAGES